MGPKLTPASEVARDRTAGFTLIELVVVVAMLSVLSVGAGLVAARSGATGATSDQQRFIRHSALLRARAVQGRQVLGLFVTPRGFQTTVETPDGWSQDQTQARWRGRVVLQLRTPRLTPDQPQILFLPDGRVSAFTLSFANQRGPRATCGSDGFGEVSCDPS